MTDQNFNFHQSLNYKIIQRKLGKAILEAKVEHKHLNTGLSGHGGYLASLLDVAGGLAGITSETWGVTLSLNVQYLSRCRLNDILTVEGLTTKIAKTVFFCNMSIRNQNNEPIAQGSGTYKYVRNPKLNK